MFGRLLVLAGLIATSTALKSCYWYNGFDARDPPGHVTNSTGWYGPGANCTVGPTSPKPCTKEDCCTQCQNPSERHPQTNESCAFSIWNPTGAACWFKTVKAVPFAKPGDVTCCPAGEGACPSAPAGGPWRLLDDFSDEFAVNFGGTAILPLNLSKWNTSVKSWGDWTWS
eukprot:Hpha_TRINITY_DN24981_c0_g1::TRINITY_DN24981_c0_g1_i1::g.111188::m.111188